MRSSRVLGLAAFAAIAAAGVTAAAAVRTYRGVQAPAVGDLASFLALPADERERRPVVACTGDSIVRGRAGVDWVRMLRERFPDLAFVNDGVNSCLAWEVLQRVEHLLACNPSHVVVMTGTNDVEATLQPDGGAGVMRARKAPQVPSLDFLGQCITGIIERLHHAGADVAVCSLPPLGQDLGDRFNQRVRQANAVIATVCEAGGATYLPVGEEYERALRAASADHGPGFSWSWRPGLQSLAWHFLRGWSYDTVAARHGLLLSADGVHPSTSGARMIADAAGEWIEAVAA